MSRYGEELRSERELRGISLERLCAETKVKASHFKALEQGDYKALPGGVFRSGIVRAYLSAVGLDEQEWLPRFRASVEEHAQLNGGSLDADEEGWVTFAENVRRNRAPKARGNGLRWVGVLLLFLLVVGAGWLLWNDVLRARLGH